ncbi:cobamide remodeling phosphodiesterase CbiR [Leadbettera azotonutricia]|uniref:AP endonuclease, family 2 n=1 Tax=Leadbettera azotonutricia (strain ATCC BAA-888 / DSM 13862 / ZAS-9) TaxID=545695 RepID=F5Y843_LEAAZ|nr:cobamide remodeling phosphodiesterase CbiR [Leadbettera azotonutricia]AEF80599.1 AP endonuclease, family 2 [Leadbettera azotonutricia ZAS-9]
MEYLLNNFPKIIVPSWVIPGTYLENLRFLDDKKEITGVELLFFIYDDEIKKNITDEFEDICKFKDRFIFTAHLPDVLNPEHEELVKKLSPLVQHFIVHPGKEGGARAQAGLINSWAEKYKNVSSKYRFLAENTNPGLLEALLPNLNTNIGLCMDFGHLLIEEKNPSAYLNQFQNKIGEIHLHGLDREKAMIDKRLPDHRPINEDSIPIKELFPLLKKFQGLVNLEVFSWEEVEESLRVIKLLLERKEK